MKLKEFIELHKNDEIEVWDTEVDIPIPFYLYGEHTFKNGVNEYGGDERGLYELENILFDLEVENVYKDTCTINVFNIAKKNWKKLYKLYTDLPYEEVEDDDEAIALCVEDVFKTISQGYYELGEDFAKALK